MFKFICIGILAFQWLLFGTMHFTMHEETVAQIPEFFPFKDFIVFITGVAEVAVGLLIIPKRTRKRAALVSLVLLIILLPAVAKIMLSDDAFLLDYWWIDAFRIILIPNNLFLAFCSWYLWKNTDSESTIS